MNLLCVLFFCMASCLCGSAGTWPGNCCLKKNSGKAPRVINVIDCKIQSAGLCPINAVIIKTRNGQNFCYDPMEKWITQHVVMNGTNSCHFLPDSKKKPKDKKADRSGKRGKRKRKQKKIQSKSDV